MRRSANETLLADIPPGLQFVLRKESEMNGLIILCVAAVIVLFLSVSSGSGGSYISGLLLGFFIALSLAKMAMGG